MPVLKRKRAGLGDAMSVVTRFVNACNRHDADAVYACLHPDFDSIQPMYPSRNFRGADQVRRNWQAIFDAEPGFRLTVLRSAAVGDTVWLELHGAGRDAEVAGVFVMGIQGDRIRWARIYSALVEPVEGAESPAPASPPVEEVPPLDATPAGEGEVVEEALIAPVVDIERSGRRRRRSRRRGEGEGSAGVSTAVVEADPEVVDAVSVDAVSVDAVSVDAVSVDPVSVDAGSVDAVSVDAGGDGERHPDESRADESHADERAGDAVAVDPESEPIVADDSPFAGEPEQSPAAAAVDVVEAEPADDTLFGAEPDAELQPEPAEPEPWRSGTPKRRFGRRSR